MGLPETLLLGFIAGATIVLGLPVGRLRRPAVTLRLVLNALAIGILLFLVWDVVTHAWEPIDAALGKVHDHTGGLAPVFGYGALFAAGIAIGLGSLVGYEMWMSRAGISRMVNARQIGATFMKFGRVPATRAIIGRATREIAQGWVREGGLSSGATRGRVDRSSTIGYANRRNAH